MVQKLSLFVQLKMFKNVFLGTSETYLKTTNTLVCKRVFMSLEV